MLVTMANSLRAVKMAGAILHEFGINSSKRLYRFLLRECEKLPREAQGFYKHSVKQSFKQHVEESDPERVQQIMEKALTDAKWILQKYNKDAVLGQKKDK